MFYSDKFGSTQDLIPTYLKLESGNSRDYVNSLQARKMMAYAKNSRVDILTFLWSHLSKKFSQKSLKEMVFIWNNEIPRLLKRIALTYKNKAVRTLADDAKTELYNALQPQLHVERKELNRMAKMFNTVLVRPIWYGERESLEHQILTQADCIVEFDNTDENKLLKVSYMRYDSTRNKEIWVHWTENDHFASEDEEGKKRIIVQGIEGNDYNRIPYEILRIEECMDFWGDGLSPIVDHQEAINGRLTDLYNKAYMSLGIPFGINLNIKKDNFVINPDKGVFVDDVDISRMANPDFRFITADQKILDDKQIIESEQKELSNSLGIPDNGVRYSSGYERELDYQEVIDINQDDEEVFRAFEHRLFKLDALIMRIDAKKDFGDVFSIEFAPIEFPKTEQDQILEWDWELEHNTTTVVDIYMKKTGITDRNEAIKILEMNKTENSKFIGQKPQTLFPNIGEQV